MGKLAFILIWVVGVLLQMLFLKIETPQWLMCYGFIVGLIGVRLDELITKCRKEAFNGF